MSRMFNPPHPGEILREEVIKPLDVSVTEAARRLGVSRVALSWILNERAGISAEMAVRLAKALDPDAELCWQVSKPLFLPFRGVGQK
jgi:addiction module HigA family antidote